MAKNIVSKLTFTLCIYLCKNFVGCTENQQPKLSFTKEHSWFFKTRSISLTSNFRHFIANGKRWQTKEMVLGETRKVK